MRFAVNLCHAGVCPYLDVRHLLNLIDEVLRHAACERTATDQDENAFCIFGKVHCGLSGRICAADNIDNFAFARHGFGRAAAVVHACALQTVHPRRLQPLPLNSGGNHQCVTREFAVVGQFQYSVRPFHACRYNFLRS